MHYGAKEPGNGTSSPLLSRVLGSECVSERASEPMGKAECRSKAGSAELIHYKNVKKSYRDNLVAIISQWNILIT